MISKNTDGANVCIICVEFLQSVDGSETAVRSYIASRYL